MKNKKSIIVIIILAVLLAGAATTSIIYKTKFDNMAQKIESIYNNDYYYVTCSTGNVKNYGLDAVRHDIQSACLSYEMLSKVGSYSTYIGVDYTYDEADTLWQSFGKLEHLIENGNVTEDDILSLLDSEEEFIRDKSDPQRAIALTEAINAVCDKYE